MARLASERLEHRGRASAWMAEVNEPVAVCRITQMALLRLLTTRAAMREDTLDRKQAWQVYDAMRADGRIVFTEEPPGLEANWRKSRVPSESGSCWTDAYLAAFAECAQLQLVTFDKPLAARVQGSVLLR